MSAQANIVAFDGAATPVSHTFVPIGTSSDPKDNSSSAFWREGIVALPIYAQGTITHKVVQLKSGVWRVSNTVSLPVMEMANGQNAAGYTAAPKVAYVNTVVVTGYFHERASIAERRLVRQLAVNVSGGVITSVVPIQTGASAELIDLNVVAS